MEEVQESIQPFEKFIAFKNLFYNNVRGHAKNDFLTFVRLTAPTLVSDWKMGRHIEIISNKLKD